MDVIKQVEFEKLASLKGKDIQPVFLYFCKTVYRLESWYELMKVFFWRLFQKEEGKAAIEKVIDKKVLGRVNVSTHKSFSWFPDAEKIVRISETLFIRVQEKIDVLDNLELIRYFRSAFWKSYGSFRLFVKERGKKPTSEELDRFYQEQKKEKRTIKQGKGLVAHINGLILSDEEKLFKRIDKEFNEKTFIGDIVLNESEEKALISFMEKEFKRLKESGKKFEPSNDKVFVLGMVLYGQRNYAEGHFWNELKDKYGITAVYQGIINETVKDILKKHHKPVVKDSNGAVDTICMHSFVTTPCAYQLFDYLFDYWRLDLDRNAENLYGENGADNFDILIDEIEANRVQSKADLMIHTTYALLHNRIGSKNRLKNYLKLMDRCFWDHEPIHDSETRIIRLLKEWTEEPDGKFKNETKKKDYKFGRGETLLLRPTLFVNYKTDVFKLRLHQQRLPNCTEEEAKDMEWHISYDGGPETVLPTTPLIGKAGIYTRETELKPFDPKNLFAKITARLVSPKLDKPLFDKSICADTVRFFDEKGKYIDHHGATIPAGIVHAFYQSDPPIVLGKKTTPYQMENYGVVLLDLDKGDLIQLPDGTSVLAGERIEDGILDTNLVPDALIAGKPIYSKLPNVLLKCKKAEIDGAFLVINDNGKPIKLEPSFVTEFKLNDNAEDVYGYLINLSNLEIEEGHVTILFKTNGRKQIFGEFYYLDGFAFGFEGAPYVFEETGTIVLPATSNIVRKGKDWDYQSNQFKLTFEIEPNEASGYSVKGRSLFLKYLLKGEELEIEFPIPALYWRFSNEKVWNHIKPQPVFFKNIPEYIHFAGPFDWRTVRMQADLSQFDVESDGLITSESDGEGKSRFKLDQIRSWIVDRTKEKAPVLLFIGSQPYYFLDVYCHSVIQNNQIFGDFENKRIFGKFEIVGGGDYSVTIFYNDEAIEDDIPIESDGTFEVETDLRQGKYKFYLYENDDSDGFFDDDEISIPLNRDDPIVAELRDITNLAGTIYQVRSIKWLNKDYSPDRIKVPTFIEVVGKIDAQHLLDLTESDSEGDDEFIINSCVYYDNPEDLLDENTVIYEGKLLEENNGKREERYPVLLIFRDKYKPQQPIVLRNVKEDSGVNPLLFDRVAGQLIRTDLLEKYKKNKGLRRKEIRELDDDKYGLNLVVEDRQ